MNNDNHDLIIDLLIREYGIWPEYVKKNGRTYKVHDDHVFFLKKITPQEGNQLLFNLNYLQTKGYDRHVPVIPTRAGKWVTYKKNHCYYLMPMIANEEGNSAEKAKIMFRELAKLHTLTNKELKPDLHRIENHYKKAKEKWQGEQAFLEKFMEQCEGRWYMSPFEWEYVQYFHDFQKAYGYAIMALERWHEFAVDKRTIQTVLIHGKLAEDHFLLDRNGFGFFISFEKGKAGSPVTDLLPFLTASLKSFPKQCDECVRWLAIYKKHYYFARGERWLLKSYLAHPGYLLPTIIGYQNAKVNREYIFTKKIQKQYWQLKNIEYVIGKLEEQSF